MEDLDTSNVYIINNHDPHYMNMEDGIIFQYDQPIILRAEDGAAETAYMPSFENGQFVIRPIATECSVEDENDSDVQDQEAYLDVDYLNENTLKQEEEEDMLISENYEEEYLDDEFTDIKDNIFILPENQETLNEEDSEEYVVTQEYLAEYIDESERSKYASVTGTDNEYIVIPENNSVLPENLNLNNKSVFDNKFSDQNVLDRDPKAPSLDYESVCSQFRIAKSDYKPSSVTIPPIIKPNTTARNSIAGRSQIKPNENCLLEGAGCKLIRLGRKHLKVDARTMIGPKEFKMQLLDSSDLVQEMDLAPRSRKQITRINNNLNYMFANPVSKMPSTLHKNFQRNCVSKKQEDYEVITDMVLLPVGATTKIDLSKIKRITRRRRYPEAEEYQRQLKLRETEVRLLMERQSNYEFIVDDPNPIGCADGNINMLINAAENASHNDILPYYNTSIYVQNSDTEEHVQQDEQSDNENDTGVTYTNNVNSIEVLLAAAGESTSEAVEGQFHKVFLYNSQVYEHGSQQFLIDENQQLILVQDDQFEEVIFDQPESILS